MGQVELDRILLFFLTKPQSNQTDKKRVGSDRVNRIRRNRYSGNIKKKERKNGPIHEKINSV